MPSSVKGRATTLNVTSFGPLEGYLEECSGQEIILAQETHVVEDRMAAMQAKAADNGYHGVWAPALPTSGGSQGGVAVLVPTHVCVTAPPGRSSPVLEARRLVAGYVHWGVRGGFAAISVHLKDGDGAPG